MLIADSAPTTDQFYVTGGTLPTDAPSYVPRQADHDLLHGLAHGEFCYVLNTRQMGKSSLMVRTAQALRAQGDTVAVLDLTAVGLNLTPDQWYGGLLASLGEQLHLEDALEDFWDDNEALGPLQRFMSALGRVALPHVSQRLVLFVDEIDAVRSLPFPADEFFAAIRECYNRRRTDPLYEKLAFCLLGVATPADLIRDTRLSPFNIGRRIALTDFTPAEAAPLAQGLPGGQGSLNRVLYWTGGHPYMTQRLCRAVAEEGVTTSAGVDAVCERLFLTKQARESDDNLAFVRARLLRSEVDLASLLDLYVQVRAGKKVKDDETNPLCGVLRLSGVAKAPGAYLEVRNRVYDRVFDREWVLAHMPDAELRRQRAAYRLGLLRAAAVAVVVLLIMGLLLASSVLNAHRAEKQTRIANEKTGIANAKTQEANRERAATKMAQQQEKQIADQRAAALLQVTGEKKLVQANADLAAAQAKVATAKSLEAHQSAVVALLQKQRADKNAAQNQQLAASLNVALRKALQSQQLSDRYLYDANMNLIQSEYENNNVGHVMQVLRDTRFSQQRGFEWGYWYHMCHLSLLTLQAPFVQSASLSPDGTRIVTVNNPLDDLHGTVRVWNARTGAFLKTLSTVGWVSSASFSPDGTRIVAVDNHGTYNKGRGQTTTIVCVWNARTFALLKKFPAGSPGFAEFSPDNARIVTTSEYGSACVWNAQTGAPLRTLPINTINNVVAGFFSPDGTRVLVASADGTTKVLDAKTGAAVLTLPTGPVDSVSYSPDGQRIFTISRTVTDAADVTARVWDARTGAPLQTLQERMDGVASMSFSPDGARIVTGYQDGTVRVWDVQTEATVLTLRGHTGWVNSALFTSDGTRIVTASSDGTVQVWDARNDRQTLTLQGQTDIVRSASYSPDGQRIVTAGFDKTARVWDARTGASLLTLQGHTDHVESASYSPDGARIVTAGKDGTARIWDAHTGHSLRTLQVSVAGSMPANSTFSAAGGGAVVSSASYSPDGTRIVTAGWDGFIHVWDARTGQPLRTLPRQLAPVYSASFSPDGSKIVTCGDDGTARIWDARTGQQMRVFQEHTGPVNSASFSPDGQRIVTAGYDKTVRIWNVQTRQQLHILEGHTSFVSSASFSSDGKRIVTASYDKTVRVWDAQSGRQLLILQGHADTVYSAVFSPDGQGIVTASADKTAKVWVSEMNKARAPDMNTAPATPAYMVPSLNTAPIAGIAKKRHASRNQPPATPLEAAGYNAGLIAGGHYDSSSTSAAFASIQRNTTATIDGCWDYYAKGFNPNTPNVGLPVGQTFASDDDPTVRFRLRLPGPSNALLLTDSSATGTLTLAHPGRFRRIALLVTSGNGNHKMHLRLNFVGGSSLSETFDAPDHFDNSLPNVALNGFDRVCVAADPNDASAVPGRFAGVNPTNPTLFDVQIALPPADARRALTSITLTKDPTEDARFGPNQNVAVFGISGG